MPNTNKNIFLGKFISSQDIAIGVKKITFELEEKIDYTPGQYVWIEIPDMQFPDLKGNRRAFSIFNLPDKNNRTISILLRQGISGYKKTIDNLKTGAPVLVHGPFGSTFLLNKKTNKNIFMIAGGVGIAPFFPTIEKITTDKSDINCKLIYLNNRKPSTALLTELENFQKINPRFKYEAIFGRFSYYFLNNIDPKKYQDFEYWISGPQKMIDYSYKILTKKGAEGSKMFFENYYPEKKNNLTIQKITKDLKKDKIFSRAIQNSTNHVVITDANGVVLFANKAVEKITGYSLSEVIGNTPRLWGGMMSAEFYKKFWKKKFSGEPFEGEIINRRKDGSLYHSIAHISPIFDKNKTIIGFIGTEEDITEIRNQEEKIQQVLKVLPVGVWLMDKDGKIIQGNESAQTIWAGAKYVGPNQFGEYKGWWNDTGKLIKPDEWAAARAINKGETSIDEEIKIKCFDGTYKIILNSAIPLRDEQEKIIGAIIVNQDITNLKKNEIKIKKLNDRFELAAGSAKIGVWEWDLKNDSIEWDKTMYELYGISPKESKSGKDLVKLRQKMIHPDDFAKIEKIRLEAIKNGKKLEYDFRIIKKSGEIRYLKVFAIIEKDKKNNPKKMIGVNWDITEEKEIDKAKSEFVSLASHQLRTPLSAINWYAEMLLAGDAGKISGDQKKYLKEIYQGNQRMINLINSLLNVSRLELGTFSVDPTPTDVTKLIKDFLKEINQSAKEKNIKISGDYNDNLKNFLADKQLLRIIIQNLISNAVKYTPNKGKVFISTYITKNDGLICGQKIKKDNLVISIKDTGMGIPESQQSKIFNKFFRADNARDSEAEGTGLGLYIIKSILETAGGTISFESQVDKGSTFCVTFPLSGMIKKDGTKKIT